MPRLPSIPAKRVVSILHEVGFKVHRIIGSHQVLIKGDQTVVVPVHGNENIPKGTLMAILKQAGVSKEKFIRITRPKSKR